MSFIKNGESEFQYLSALERRVQLLEDPVAAELVVLLGTYTPTISILTGPSDATLVALTPWRVERTRQGGFAELVKVSGVVSISTANPAVRTVAIEAPFGTDVGLAVGDLSGFWQPVSGTATAVLCEVDSTGDAQVGPVLIAAGLVSVSFSYFVRV